MKSIIKTASVALATVLAFAAAAQAQSLAFKEEAVRQDQELAKLVELANTQCGTKLTASFDWPTFKDADILGVSHSVNGYCGQALDAITNVCGGSELGKKAVQEQITGIKCSTGDKAAFELKDKVLNYTIDFKASSQVEPMRDYLKANLK